MAKKEKKEVEALGTSILGLQQANKKLREERNKLDTTTADGISKIKALNDQINKNTEAIKNNTDAITKQKVS